FWMASCDRPFSATSGTGNYPTSSADIAAYSAEGAANCLEKSAAVHRARFELRALCPLVPGVQEDGRLLPAKCQSSREKTFYPPLKLCPRSAVKYRRVGFATRRVAPRRSRTP